MGRQDPASRRVSNLTDSQVERKRAIDRANQQHCQRRKKARLQWLEQEVVRLAEALEAAESQLRRQLDGCVCGAAGRRDSTAPEAEQAAARPTPTAGTTGWPATAAAAAGDHSTSVDGLARTDVPLGLSPSHGDAVWTVNLRELLDPIHDLDLGDRVFAFQMPLPDGDLTPSPRSAVADDGRAALGGLPLPPPAPPATVPDWQAVPLHLPPANELDRFICETTQAGRRLQQQTGGAGELAQAEFPSISSLLNPNLGDDGTKPLTLALATHVVRRYNMRSVTTRIALMYTLAHLLRWLVCRSKASYDTLPAFLQPTRLQRTVAHPPWVDLIAWPAARDAIIRGRTWLATAAEFDNFRVKTGASMSVNWPYTDSGAFLDLGDGQNLVLSPLFESHIRRAENWTLDKATVTEFPFLRAFCRELDET